MNRLRSDLAHAVRRLARAPVFAAIVILTLALGIGANAAIFSMVRTVLIRPLPYGDPDRLVMLWGKIEKGETTYLSGPEVREYAAQEATFDDVAAYTGSAANLTGGAEPERVITAFVSPNIFATLGVGAVVGRAFAPSDRAVDIGDRVVLGYGLWQRRFGGSADVVGQQVIVNGVQRTVMGVMPAGFELPLDFGEERPSELWVPLDLGSSDWAEWGNHSLIGVARLARGVTPEMATATMRRLEDRWIREVVGGGWSDRDVVRRAAIPVPDLVLGDVRTALWMLLGAVGVILLIACANVANLILARSDERQREIAIRSAIGASRWRVVQQLLTESVLLSTLGGVVGLALAYLGIRLLVALSPPGIPRLDEAGIDYGILLFTMILALATGVLFGVAPALSLSRPDLGRALKEGGRTGTVGRASQRFRDSLAVLQMGLSVVLLIGALLLVRSFIELRRIDPGFDPEGALTMRVALPVATYPENDDVIRIVTLLRQRLAELPGVSAAGATRLLPLTGTIGDWSITLEGREKLPGENPNGDWQVVTPGYFESMGMRLVRGRPFTETDDADSPIVAVINETMARRYWPDEEPIGKRFHLGSSARPWITIVGVSEQVRQNAITEEPRAEMYVPHAQWSAAGAGLPRGMTFILRTAGDPLAVLGPARAVVRSLDPELPIAEVRTLRQVTADALAPARFTASLLAAFAALALVLATVGIFGVLSLLVARRHQEIGIRMALGASASAITGMILGRGMALAAIGVGAGLLAAVALTRVVTSLLYGVTELDPLTFAAAPALLVLVALVACLVPARRAARLDPVVALRE
jgi:putative ABC transport system permease protein